MRRVNKELTLLNKLKLVTFILIGATWQKLFLEKFESHAQMDVESGEMRTNEIGIRQKHFIFSNTRQIHQLDLASNLP
jgi:hypothetical protein